MYSHVRAKLTLITGEMYIKYNAFDFIRRNLTGRKIE